jgi:neurotransmitter:Na+ symporter, NSS family
MEKTASGEDRGQFTTNIGFLLAAVGSAVGLGNIWRFPFVTAENGGAVFVLIYLIVLLVLGVPVMLAELSIGRRGGTNIVGNLQRLYQQATGGENRKGHTFWTFAGYFFILFCIFTISWYFVLGGWVLQYFTGAFTNAHLADPQAYFFQISQGTNTMVAHLIVVALTVAVVSFGIQKGIERVVLVVMPLLFLMIGALAVWALFLPGAGEGYAFLLRPDWSQVTGSTIVAAVGQAFFSLSLGFGIMITYASYLSKKESLTKNGPTIALADSGVALAAGFMLFPILASFGLLVGTVEGGGGRAAVFLAMPEAFALAGGLGGQILTIVFFFLLFLAAYSSALAIFEVVVSYLSDRLAWGRRRITIAIGLIAYTAGILPAMSLNVYDWFSGDLTDLLVIIGGLLVVVFAGFIAKTTAQEIDKNSRVGLSRITMPLLRYFAPVVLGALLLVFLHGFLTDPGTFNVPADIANVVVAVTAVVVVLGFAIGLGRWIHKDAKKHGEVAYAWSSLFVILWCTTLIGGLIVLGVWRDRRDQGLLATNGFSNPTKRYHATSK